MINLKYPSKSPSSYDINKKKKSSDKNTYIVEEDKNGKKQWKLYKIHKDNSFSDFTDDDYSVFDIFIQYKKVYDLIIERSLEYKINITFDAKEAKFNIEYKKLSDNKKFTKTTGFLIGKLVNNTFVWNDIFRKIYKDLFVDDSKYSIKYKFIKSILILFDHKIITFPKKYRQLIPCILSFYDDIFHSIRFAEDDISNDFTFFAIPLPLDKLPYETTSRNNIIKQLTDMNGGSYKKKNNKLNKKLKNKIIKKNSLHINNELNLFSITEN